jgi:integrase
MSAIFHHAMRYEWVERNPIKLVRQSAKRERTPDILELAELQLLLSKLSVRERTLALLDAATGLRVSELLALRWVAVGNGRCPTDASITCCTSSPRSLIVPVLSPLVTASVASWLRSFAM